MPTGQETGRLSEQAWAGRRIAPGAGGPWIAASRGPAELGKHAHPFNPPQAPRRALGRALPPAEPGDKAIRKKGPVHPPRCRLRAAGVLCAHTQPLVTWVPPPPRAAGCEVQCVPSAMEPGWTGSTWLGVCRTTPSLTCAGNDEHGKFSWCPSSHRDTGAKETNTKKQENGRGWGWGRKKERKKGKDRFFLVRRTLGIYSLSNSQCPPPPVSALVSMGCTTCVLEESTTPRHTGHHP